MPSWVSVSVVMGCRGAIYRADVPALIAVLSGTVWPADALQLLGDAVLVAARGQADSAGSPGRRCVAELRERAWEGDEELGRRFPGC